MDDLVPRHEDEVVPYERGTPLSKVLKGALTRFLPASVVSFLGVFVGISAFPSGQLVTYLYQLLSYSGIVTAGFSVGLLGLARFLFPDAQVDGRRSVLAGLLTPLIVLYAPQLFGFGLRYGQMVLFFVATGMVMALLSFFPWLTPTPPDMRETGRVALEKKGGSELPRGER